MSAARSGRPIFWTPLLAAVLAGGALAQPDSDGLEACAAISNRSERLDCYDRLATGDAPAVESEPATRSESGAPSDSAARSATARDSGSAAAAEGERGPAPDATEAVEVPVETLPPSRAERRTQRRAEAGAANLSILVVQRVENLSGLSVFVAEDGTIYDQVSPRQSRYPDLPFIAELESASRKSYWLRTEARGPAIRVVERD